VRSTLPPGKNVVAFQCRNPIHRAHYELLIRSQQQVENSVVLIHPTCGPTQPGDIDGKKRYETYLKLQEEVKNENLQWAYLPYSMRMAGPREALMHMIIRLKKTGKRLCVCLLFCFRKNFGCTHFIIGRDMAGTKSTLTGNDFYGAFDAQDVAKRYSEELGIEVVPSPEMVFTEEKGYLSKEEAKQSGLKPLKLSGTEFRRRLKANETIPSWFAFPAVVDVLRNQMKEETKTKKVETVVRKEKTVQEQEKEQTA